MKKFLIFDFRFMIVAAAVACGSASGQTLTTLSASNVTAWSANLFGSYTNLATGKTYSVQFAYGPTDGGPNAGAWAGFSGAISVSPTGTAASANYSRTIIGLTASTQYYYRAAALDFGSFNYLWATQSLTFTTRGASPTSMPDVAYMSVVVDTSGVLHFPTNFFDANGIVPSNGVTELNARIGSNEVAVATINTQMLPRTGGVATGSFELQNITGSENSSNTISLRPTIGGGSEFNRGYAEIGSVLGSVMGIGWIRLGNVTNSAIISRGGLPFFFFDWQSFTNIASIWSSNILAQSATINSISGSLTGRYVAAGNTATGTRSSVAAGSGNEASAENSFVGGGQNNTANGFQSFIGGGLANEVRASMDSSSVVGGYGNKVTNSYSFIGGGQANIAGGYNSVIAGGQVNKTHGDYAAIPGGLNNIAMAYSFAAGLNASATSRHSFVWSDGAAISSTTRSQVTFRAGGGFRIIGGELTADIGGGTNLPVTGLRLLNTYTGGVMRLVTPDGVNFFLQ